MVGMAIAAEFTASLPYAAQRSSVSLGFVRLYAPRFSSDLKAEAKMS